MVTVGYLLYVVIAFDYFTFAHGVTITTCTICFYMCVSCLFLSLSRFLGPCHTKHKKHKIFRNSISELLELAFEVRERSALTLRHLLNNSDQMTPHTETMSRQGEFVSFTHMRRWFLNSSSGEMLQRSEHSSV